MESVRIHAETEHRASDRVAVQWGLVHHARVHDEHARCQEEYLVDVAGVEDDGRSIGGDIAKAIVHVGCRTHVEAARRILGDDRARLR